MIDIRDREVMVANLRDAQRRFEKHAPVPVVARELLRQLADALNDSGPLELDVTAEKWLGAVRSADRGIQSVEANPSAKTVRLARRSLRDLELFFARRNTWGRRLIAWVCRVCLMVILLIPVAIVIRSHDKVRALMWIAIVIGGLTLLGFLIAVYERRYKPNARAAARWLGLPDRQLFAHVVSADSSEHPHPRARLLYVHPVLIATDRRLVLARAGHAAPGSTDRHKFEFGWEIPYSDVTAFSSWTAGGEHPVEVVTVTSSKREISYALEPADGKALAAILRHRAPDAITESTAAAPTEPINAERSDAVASRPRFSKGWIGVLLVLVLTGVGVTFAAGNGGRSPGTATRSGPDPAPVVRTMMVAGEGGDGAAACAQLTPALVNEISGGTGLAGCAQAAVMKASPKRQQEAAAATLTPTVKGDRGGVTISSPDRSIGDPFEGNSNVHLVRVDGVWKVSCLGYCEGIVP